MNDPTIAESARRPYGPRFPVLNRVRARTYRAAAHTAPVILLVGIWFAATGPLHMIGPLQLPSPEAVFSSFERISGPGYAGAPLLTQIWSSVRLVTIGFVVAVFSGVPLGLLMGVNHRANVCINPLFQLIRPIAPIAWIPLTILWFGLGDVAKVFVVWLAAFAPSVINTQTAVRGVSQTAIEAARVHGATRTRIFFDVTAPASLPGIFTGMRLSLQACWMVLVAAELVGAYTGLGHVMIIATQNLDPGMIVVAMLCVATLGVAMSFMLAILERLVVPWR